MDGESDQERQKHEQEERLPDLPGIDFDGPQSFAAKSSGKSMAVPTISKTIRPVANGRKIRKLAIIVRCKTMSFHKDVDEKIKEAIARGEFDNLPGKGKALNLDAYFAMPEHLRMGYSILKSADIIPEEIELLRQIEGLKKSLDSSTTPMEQKALRQQLSEKLTNLNMRMEHNRKVRQI